MPTTLLLAHPDLKSQRHLCIVKQYLLLIKNSLKILWSEVWKGGFQLMQILGLLGMYFDAVAAEVKNNLSPSAMYFIKQFRWIIICVF